MCDQVCLPTYLGLVDGPQLLVHVQRLVREFRHRRGEDQVLARGVAWCGGGPGRRRLLGRHKLWVAALGPGVKEAAEGLGWRAYLQGLGFRD